MLTTLPFPKPALSKSVVLNTARRIKLAFQELNRDEQGMNTVEAIILLFVAAIVLLVFFAFIWPLIRDEVLKQLRLLLGQTGEPNQ